jgi:hypothetical protein
MEKRILRSPGASEKIPGPERGTAIYWFVEWFRVPRGRISESLLESHLEGLTADHAPAERVEIVVLCAAIVALASHDSEHRGMGIYGVVKLFALPVFQVRNGGTPGGSQHPKTSPIHNPA